MRVLPVLSLLACLAPSVSAQTRSVAITVDDLPCAYCSTVLADGSSGHGVLVDTNQRLIDKLKRGHIPVTGFVVTGGTDEPGSPQQKAMQLWARSGFELGNHSDSHPNFNDLTVEQMETEVTRADVILRPLLADNGHQLQFFRFPGNSTGDTQAKHDALAAFLKAHNYQIATCTIENEDYVFAPAYSRAMGTHDSATAARIRREYLAYTASEIDFYAALNKRVLGYEPPEVMLLHDSLLNADMMDDVLALFRTRAYKFITLGKAQSDPAYTIPDTYITSYGPMWGWRWAQDRHLGPLHMGDTEPPAWVTAYAEGKGTSAAEIKDQQ